jgi:hypothetical protein
MRRPVATGAWIRNNRIAEPPRRSAPRRKPACQGETPSAAREIVRPWPLTRSAKPRCEKRDASSVSRYSATAAPEIECRWRPAQRHSRRTRPREHIFGMCLSGSIELRTGYAGKPCCSRASLTSLRALDRNSGRLPGSAADDELTIPTRTTVVSSERHAAAPSRRECTTPASSFRARQRPARG